MIKKLFSGMYLIILGLSALEIFNSYGFIKGYLGFHLWQIVVIYLASLAVARVWQGERLLPSWLTKFNLRLLPIMILLFLVSYLPNIFAARDLVIGSLTLNHFPFLELTGLSYFIHMLSLSTKEIKERGSGILFWGFIFVCALLYTYAFHIFYVISYNGGGEYDDNLMEWLQVVILAVGSLVATYLTITTKHGIKLRILYLLSALVFVFLAGEEISWGQRFLDIEVEVTESNYQLEYNIHNKQGFNELASVVYYLAFIYAWVSSKFYHRVKGTKWELLCFTRVEVLYLLPTFLFNPYLDRTLISGYPTMLDIYFQAGIVPDYIRALEFLASWRESFEVLFYTGLVIHFTNLIKSRR